MPCDGPRLVAWPCRTDSSRVMSFRDRLMLAAWVGGVMTGKLPLLEGSLTSSLLSSSAALIDVLGVMTSSVTSMVLTELSSKELLLLRPDLKPGASSILSGVMSIDWLDMDGLMKMDVDR